MLFGFQRPNKWMSYDGKVVGVKDGDTYVVLIGNLPKVIRLAHVDCPEKKQPYGREAKKFGSDFCFGKIVKVITNGTIDRNNRMIAEIYIANHCLNKELIKSGLAWHFKKYSKDYEYAELEIEARQSAKGIWSKKVSIAPWIWRKSVRMKDS